MVVVLAVQILDMQGDAGILGERLEPFLKQLGIHLAEFRPADRHLPDQVGAVRDVERDTGQRLVHRDQRIAVAQDAGRSEEHTSELQSLMRPSYAVFCLKTQRFNAWEPRSPGTTCQSEWRCLAG